MSECIMAYGLNEGQGHNIVLPKKVKLVSQSLLFGQTYSTLIFCSNVFKIQFEAVLICLFLKENSKTF